MNYEEKYKEVFKRAEAIIRFYKNQNRDDETSIKDLELIFPELKESEGEKVRKEIIAVFKGEISYTSEEDAQKYIAWLKKQGEQKPYGQRQECADCQFNYAGECKGSCSMKRGEQNPTDKNEPKKELAESYLAKFDEKFPILPTLKGKQLADYKNFLNKCQQIFRLKYWGIRPIQAKLFEKLSLLLAAWGAEHLQDPGQTDGNTDNGKQGWSEEDKRMFDYALDMIEWYSGKNEDKSRLVSNWLKSLKGRVQPQPKQEWSEEEIEKAAQEWELKANFNPFYMTMDGDKPTGVKQDITTHKESFKAGVNWTLKSLRPQNIYNPYKAVVESIAEMCKHYDKASHSGLRDFYDNVKVKCKDAQEYDKMFPQAQWKPSDEQMEALDWQVENTSVSSWQYKATKELMEDLKKLKEE